LNDENFCRVEFSGRLIAVEGLDGSGKSTQIYLLKRWLEAEGTRSIQRVELVGNW